MEICYNEPVYNAGAFID